MPTYLDEKHRRISQFAEYLRLMGLRPIRSSRTVASSSSTTRLPKMPSHPSSRNRWRSRSIVWPVVARHRAEGSRAKACRTMAGRGNSPRYIQFAFMQDCFYMELPNNTVFPPEVEQILRGSMGFYWAKDRPDLRWVRATGRTW